MTSQATVLIPNLFTPHPHLSEEVNRNIVQSEIEGGVYLDKLLEGTMLEVETQHRFYTIINCGRGRALISGHPKFCPDPILVRIEGSTWGVCSAKNLALLNFRPLFMPLPSPVGIHDADRPEQGFLPLGDHAEYGDLKFVAPECLLRVQECLAPGWSVCGLGCNEPPTPSGLSPGVSRSAESGNPDTRGGCFRLGVPRKRSPGAPGKAFSRCSSPLPSGPNRARRSKCCRGRGRGTGYGFSPVMTSRNCWSVQSALG